MGRERRGSKRGRWGVAALLPPALSAIVTSCRAAHDRGAEARTGDAAPSATVGPTGHAALIDAATKEELAPSPRDARADPYDGGSRAANGRSIFSCARGFEASDVPDTVHAHDLDAVHRSLPNVSAKVAFESEMDGRTAPDRLGKTLPAFATPASVAKWTGHPDPAHVVLTGAVRWPGSDLWLAVAGSKDVRLAVVRPAGLPDAGGPVRVVARTPDAVVPRADWTILPDDYRPVSEDTPPGDDTDGAPAELEDDEEVAAFDLAAYRIRDDERAFGLRIQKSEGYAGGFGSFETLTLLRVVGAAIVPILDVPIRSTKMLAGAWNPDQTRQHETLSVDLVIELGSERVEGFRDLLLHPAGARRAIRYRWDKGKGEYRCE